MKLSHVAAAVLFAGIVGLAAQTPPRLEPGELPGGSYRLVNGWRVKPEGRQIPLDTMPMASVTTPDGKYLIVLCGGRNPPSLIVLEEDTLKERGRIPVPDGWLGLAIHPAGDRVYVGGGSEGAVFEFRFANGALTPARRIDLVEPARRTQEDFVGDVALTPDGKRLYAARLFRNGIDVINLETGKVEDRFGTGRRPYRILPHPDGAYLYVSSWADGTIYRHRSAKGELVDKLPLAPHTSDMLFVPGRVEREATEEAGAAAPAMPLSYVARLFVTAGNTNNAYVLGVEENGSLALHETINLSMTQWQPVGLTPSALTYNPRKKWLHVVCSDANAVGVVDVKSARAQVLGFVPVGVYPVAARVLSQDRLMVMNAEGHPFGSNQEGSNPPRRTGTASIIDALDAERLVSLTREVLRNSPYRDERLIDARVPAGNPIPNAPGQASPIKHVVYVLKGNLTYDQVLGDLPQGRGSRSLTVFGENITPNHHKLAREFVLFDNFYANGDGIADGASWSGAAIASDFVRRMALSHGGGRRMHGTGEGGEAAATPPGGYLWTNASLAGVTLRNYGWWSENHPKPLPDGTQIARVQDPVLEKFTNRKYRAVDLRYPDTDRVKTVLEDLAGFEKTGSMPQLLLIRLGNDRFDNPAGETQARAELVTDNDLALGMLVEAISRSRFWKDTAIFVLEASGQDGQDHVNGHRAPVFVISPYSRRGAVDSNFYNTTSALRTMELILGMRPMTQFDAGSFPMWTAFEAQPDARPYTRVEAPAGPTIPAGKNLP
ncbi:MAG: bifunctional YncE family protein/alkaline phosphatase family protein [Bryobacterales bacterium]|nr:bifunctional YncE family protein/alkaline phosphatase family protein [Bryobacterales bacterium]